jgi:hypothetical protein
MLLFSKSIVLLPIVPFPTQAAVRVRALKPEHYRAAAPGQMEKKVHP